MKRDIARMLVEFPEGWSRSKKQYASILLPPPSERGRGDVIWLGQKYDFSHSGNKSRIRYGKRDIENLEAAPDSSVVRIRNDRGVFRFQKRKGEWALVEEE